jgi:hypothetical protein
LVVAVGVPVRVLYLVEREASGGEEGTVLVAVVARGITSGS